MTGQEIAIYLQNVIGYLEFLMAYADFWHNQTYEPSCIYNKNEQRVYNEMHTSEWWWKQYKKYPSQAIIISILISNNKIVINLSHRD